MAEMKPGYPTLRHFVYLGRAGSAVRKRAVRAGLAPVNAKTFRSKWLNTFAGTRFVYGGTWHDTVNY